MNTTITVIIKDDQVIAVEPATGRELHVVDELTPELIEAMARESEQEGQR